MNPYCRIWTGDDDLNHLEWLAELQGTAGTKSPLDWVVDILVRRPKASTVVLAAALIAQDQRARYADRIPSYFDITSAILEAVQTDTAQEAAWIATDLQVGWERLDHANKRAKYQP